MIQIVRGSAAGWLVLSLAAGCEDRIDLDPLDDAAPIESRIRPKPISGGTLMLTSVGYAVASDPDRDLIHVVDVGARKVRATITLAPGDEPGRAVEGDEGVVHVVLRGFGGVATIDPGAGEVTSRTWLCPEPRGIARDPSDSTFHVACADGALLQLDPAAREIIGRTELEPDLRDVVVFDGSVLASVFRAAELVRADGQRIDVPTDIGISRVAWRTWAVPNFGGEAEGTVVMLHQISSTEPVPIDVDPDDLAGGASPYGGGGSFCEQGITTPALTLLTAEHRTTMPLSGARLTVDAAISPEENFVALAMPGQSEDHSSVQVIALGDSCGLVGETVPAAVGQGQVTSVAYMPDGVLLAQSREPARLLILAEDGRGALDIIELEGESRLDTGHEIFHRATESTLSCASCHPEGGDDGHVWTFEGIGKRRTQALDVGLEHTEPFHWDGDMQDLDMIMGEVLAHRMGGHRQSKSRRESFARWMFEQERPVADASKDDAAVVADGQALFAAYACTKCHSGSKLGGANTESFRGQELQVPNLRRVSLRPPFMHDGRAVTLEDAVRDMVEGTLEIDAPNADIAAMAAYLRTL